MIFVAFKILVFSLKSDEIFVFMQKKSLYTSCPKQSLEKYCYFDASYWVFGFLLVVQQLLPNAGGLWIVVS